MYYYPENWPESQWERDIKKISEMGFEFVPLAFPANAQHQSRVIKHNGFYTNPIFDKWI